MHDDLLMAWFEKRFGRPAYSHDTNGYDPYYLEWVERWKKGPDAFFGHMDGDSYRSFVTLLDMRFLGRSEEITDASDYDQDVEWCYESFDTEKIKGYICTRPKGHKGPHACLHGSVICAVEGASE